jgi:hypothetical protein
MLGNGCGADAIDFVVLNGAGQVLGIEQKNGRLGEAQGKLFKDCGEERKSMGDQILRSVDGIRDKFAYQVGTKPGLDIEYLVYCPDHAVKRISAAELDQEPGRDQPHAAQAASNSLDGTDTSWIGR